MGSTGAALRRGATAGLVGTAVMTVSQAVEGKITGRPPSTVPGKVGVTLLGGDKDDSTRVRALNPWVHWGHGIAMGALRGVLGQRVAGSAAATGTHFAGLWSGDVLLYQALGVAPPPWEWSPQELTTDIGHKGLYALVTGATYDALDRRAERRSGSAQRAGGGQPDVDAGGVVHERRMPRLR
jgi:hypothetical protein